MANDVIIIEIEKMMATSSGKMNLVISTTIQPGELVALFGPSGSGKTTLLRILAGLTTPDRGYIKFGDTVWFDSKNKINITPQCRNISLMFQDYALFPNMTVKKNILFAQSDNNDTSINELISICGLKELVNYKPNGLSGGQKQRVALVRALVRKSQLLLLDEPLSSLDDEMRLTLQNEIEQTHKLSGTTTIMVSHDIQEVLRLANQVLWIEDGTIIRSGTPENVFNSLNTKLNVLRS